MASDILGNDLTLVGIAVTGSLAIAPEGTALVTPEEGSEPDLTLPVAFRKIGLLTEDGGFAWSSEQEDPIEFFQSSYKIASGEGSYELVVKAAEYNSLVRELLSGQTPDEHGHVTISAGGSGKSYVLFSEEVFKNRNVRRRQAIATVTNVQLDTTERGTVNGAEITFAVSANPAIGYSHLSEWVVSLDA